MALIFTSTIESAIKLLKTYDNPQDLIKIVWQRQSKTDAHISNTQLLNLLDNKTSSTDSEWPTDY